MNRSCINLESVFSLNCPATILSVLAKTLWTRANVSSFLSSRRRHTRFDCDWSSDVCSSDLSRFRHRLWERGADKLKSFHCWLPVKHRREGHHYSWIAREVIGLSVLLRIPPTFGNQIGRASCRERV